MAQALYSKTAGGRNLERAHFKAVEQGKPSPVSCYGCGRRENLVSFAVVNIEPFCLCGDCDEEVRAMGAIFRLTEA